MSVQSYYLKLLWNVLIKIVAHVYHNMEIWLVNHFFFNLLGIAFDRNFPKKIVSIDIAM